MEQALDFMDLAFDIGGKIITARVPVQLVSRLYEDETFRSEYFKNYLPSAEPLHLPSIQTELQPEQEFRWMDESIKLLINSYAEEKENFRNPKMKKCALWQKINTVMNEYGHHTTPDTCDKKFRNLKVTYKSIKDKMKKSGRARQQWTYLEAMDEIFVDDATINPPFLMSSLKRREGDGDPQPSGIQQPSTSSAELSDEVQTNDQRDRLEHLASSANTLQDASETVGDVSEGDAETVDQSANRTRKRKNRELTEFRNKVLLLESEKVNELKQLNVTYKEIVKEMREKTQVLKEILLLNKNK